MLWKVSLRYTFFVTAHALIFPIDRIKSIISPQESLTPGLLYVGVATLSGSILARNRRLATRLILPPIFLVTSAKHFLPRTTHNLSDYLGSIEDAHFPAIAEKHEIGKAHTAMTWERIKETTKDARGRVNSGAVSIVERIQDATGLKLRDTLGQGEEAKQYVEAKVTEVQQGAEQAQEGAKIGVDKKVEEVEGEAEGKVKSEEKKAEEQRLI